MANMLEAMAAGIDGDKKVKGKGLTPLVSEQPTYHAPDVPGDFLTHEGLASIEQNLRRDAAAMLKIADGIAIALGGTPVIEGTGAGAVLTTAEKQREKEREADARVAAARSEKDDTEDEDAALVEAAKELVEAAEAQEVFDARIAAQTAAAQAATFTPEPAEAPAPTGGACPDCSGWDCPNGHDTVEATTSPRGRHFHRCTTCGAFQR